MKLIITTLTIFIISFIASSSENQTFNCKKLKINIEGNIYNYFANLEKESLRKYSDHKQRAEKFLDIASKQANIYNVLCDD